MNGKTGALTNTAGTAGSSVKPISSSVFPTMSCDASATSGTPTALAMNGTVRDARGLTSSTNTSPRRTANCTFISPTTPRRTASRSAMSRMVSRFAGETL